MNHFQLSLSFCGVTHFLHLMYLNNNNMSEHHVMAKTVRPTGTSCRNCMHTVWVRQQQITQTDCAFLSIWVHSYVSDSTNTYCSIPSEHTALIHHKFNHNFFNMYIDYIEWVPLFIPEWKKKSLSLQPTHCHIRVIKYCIWFLWGSNAGPSVYKANMITTTLWDHQKKRGLKLRIEPRPPSWARREFSHWSTNACYTSWWCHTNLWRLLAHKYDNMHLWSLVCSSNRLEVEILSYFVIVGSTTSIFQYCTTAQHFLHVATKAPTHYNKSNWVKRQLANEILLSV